MNTATSYNEVEDALEVTPLIMDLNNSLLNPYNLVVFYPWKKIDWNSSPHLNHSVFSSLGILLFHILFLFSLCEWDYQSPLLLLDINDIAYGNHFLYLLKCLSSLIAGF